MAHPVSFPRQRTAHLPGRAGSGMIAPRFQPVRPMSVIVDTFIAPHVHRTFPLEQGPPRRTGSWRAAYRRQIVLTT